MHVLILLNQRFWFPGPEEGGIDGARRDGVDCNALRSQLLRQDAGHLFNGALRGDIEEMGLRDHRICCERCREENYTASYMTRGELLDKVR